MLDGNQRHKPGSEDWRHNVPAAETTAPSLSETVSVQSRPKSPPTHQGTSPERKLHKCMHHYQHIKQIYTSLLTSRGDASVHVRRTNHQAM